MDLWILRHAAAEDRSASGRDADRPLTREGVERARRVGRGLKALNSEIELILTSPYLRARQTAEAAAKALGPASKLEESRALEPGRDPREILEELRAEDRASALLVGHQPHLGSLLGLLVTGEPKLEIPLKKAALARVSWDGSGAGTLELVLPAGALERLFGRR
jgi:phosphohistidine phosphatase